MSEAASSAADGSPAGEAQPLWVFLERYCLVRSVERGALDDEIQMLHIVSHCFGTRWDDCRICHADECRSQSTQNLDGAHSELAGFIESKHKVIVPSRHRHHETQHSVSVLDIASIQIMPPEPTQKVFNLIDCLDCSSWVVDRGRERLDGNVDQQTDRIFRILFERAFRLEMNGSH